MTAALLEAPPGAMTRDEMIEDQQGLVVNIAKEHRGRGVDFEDLVSAGNLGLIRAVDQFEPERKVKLSTYAAYWVRQAIQREISNTSRAVRIPVWACEVLAKYKATAKALAQDGGPPSRDAVLDAMGLDGPARRTMHMALRAASMTSMPIDDDLDLLAAEEEVEDGRHEELRDRMEALEPEAFGLLRLVYGFGPDGGMSVRSAGLRLRMGPNRAYRLHEEALAALRETTTPPFRADRGTSRAHA